MIDIPFSGSALLQQWLAAPLHFLHLLVCLVSLAACFYVAGASVCRMRHAAHAVQHGWRLLYVGVFAHALFSALAVIDGSANLRDHLLCLLVAAYVHLTARAWRDGVPVIASKAAAS